MARFTSGFLTVTFLVTLTFLLEVNGHGRLITPPGRATAWRYGFNTPHDYNDNQLFCGGSDVQKRNGGKCGICGDAFTDPQPRAHENGGTYGRGVIVATYNEGEQITARVQLTAAHKGYYEFRLCPLHDRSAPATQECLDKNLLKQPDGSTKFLAGQMAATHSIPLKLPPGLTCEQCVFQWRYHTGNSWGVDADGTSGLGHGHQEEFYGCADVKIVGTAEEGGEEGQEKEEEKDKENEEEENEEDDEAGWGDKEEEDWEKEKEKEEEDKDNEEDVDDDEDDEEWEQDQDNDSGKVRIPNTSAIDKPNVRCESWGPWKGQTEIDTWCQQNCLHTPQRCPENMCECYEYRPLIPPPGPNPQPLPPALLPRPPLPPLLPRPRPGEEDEDTLDDQGNNGGDENEQEDQDQERTAVFKCGFKNNPLQDNQLDDLCAPKCDRTTGGCTNRYCECQRQDCTRYVASGAYAAQPAMDTFCQLRCQGGNGRMCPWEVCTCGAQEQEGDGVQQVFRCHGREGTAVEKIVGFGKFCESVCDLRGVSLCPTDCICSLQ